jgi:hypothetical protein
MSSLRRIHSSRANAARSRGPITAEGQERSSANAIRHALLATCAVLENESGPCFDDLVTQHTQRFAPADGEAARIADAFAELAASPELNLLHRYKTRLHRIYQRALYNLALLGERIVPIPALAACMWAAAGDKAFSKFRPAIGCPFEQPGKGRRRVQARTVGHYRVCVTVETERFPLHLAAAEIARRSR